MAVAGCSSSLRVTDTAAQPMVVAPVSDLPVPQVPLTDALIHERNVFINAATAMVGQPYHWGGSAPGGFDCSGLVVYAASLAGFAVPRTTFQQIQAGLPASRATLDKGDLVFMRLAHKELHVGIAIDHLHFVHAPSAGGYVRIDSLDAPPYAQSFITARRLLTAERRASLAP